MDQFLASDAPTFSQSASSSSASSASANILPPWRQPVQQHFPAAEEWQPQEEYQPEKKVDLQNDQYPNFLPKEKIKTARLIHSRPKQRAKPQDTEETKRAVSAHSVEDRKRKHADWDDADPKDDKQQPWDMRGPPGPQEGGPEMWRSQKYRPNTGRWANSGGKHRDKYQLWRQKANQGLKGTELAFFHPMTKGGYWEQHCKKLGEMTPRDEKEI
jgi:hypothetical protein